MLIMPIDSWECHSPARWLIYKSRSRSWQLSFGFDLSVKLVIFCHYRVKRTVTHDLQFTPLLCWIIKISVLLYFRKLKKFYFGAKGHYWHIVMGHMEACLSSAEEEMLLCERGLPLISQVTDQLGKDKQRMHMFFLIKDFWLMRP